MSDSPKRTIAADTLIVYGLFLIPATLLLFVVWLRSLNWETMIDVPVFMYTGFLMDRFGMVPVRDFFTYNMLGTHIVFRWLYHFFGDTNLGLRLADSAVLTVILALMLLMLSRFGARVAWFAAVAFGLLHLHYGPLAYLQRDFLALIPLTLMVLSASVWFDRRPVIRWLVSGLFCGTLFTIKPHLLIGGGVILVFLIVDRDSIERVTFADWGRRVLQVATFFCIGAALPVIYMIAYYTYYGVFGQWVGVMTGFFPLHADISGERKVFEPGERLPFTLEVMLSIVPWGDFQLAMATIGGLMLFLLVPVTDLRERRYGSLLFTLTIVYFVYPCFAGRFYDHHFYPFRYLACIWMAWSLRSRSLSSPQSLHVFARTVCAFSVISLFYADIAFSSRPRESLPDSIAPPYRTERISKWLERRLQPEDTVQAIEWGFCGITHALLRNEVKSATGIIWAEGLFHHVSDPFIQDLRRGFLRELNKTKPRFVIRSKMDWDYMSGKDCSQDFHELDEFLKGHYFIVLDTRDYRIWELNESPSAEADKTAALNSQELKADFNRLTLIGAHSGKTQVPSPEAAESKVEIAAR